MATNTPTSSTTTSSLFDRMGGDDAIHAAVEEYNYRVRHDKELEKFFVGTNAEFLKRHERRFFTMAFSGRLPGHVHKVLMERHRRLFDMGLNEHHFDLVIFKHMVDSLKHLNVQQDFIDEAIAVLAPLRPVFEDGYKLYYENNEEKEKEEEEEKKDEADNKE